MAKQQSGKKAKGIAKTVPHKGTTAAHASHEDGVHHAVGIWNLHVMLLSEGDFWVAQGLEIDYVVQGDSIEDAKRNFSYGLKSTIDLNLRMYGNIEGLLSFAPNEVLQEASRSKEPLKLYSQVSMHELGIESQRSLPFDGVRFLTATA
jgi:hypothetical protein